LFFETFLRRGKGTKKQIRVCFLLSVGDKKKKPKRDHGKDEFPNLFVYLFCLKYFNITLLAESGWH